MLFLLCISVIIFHLLQLISVGSADEVALHVIYVAIGVHEIFLSFALYLYAPHDYVVLDVYAFFFLLSFHHLLTADVEPNVGSTDIDLVMLVLWLIDSSHLLIRLLTVELLLIGLLWALFMEWLLYLLLLLHLLTVTLQ